MSCLTIFNSLPLPQTALQNYWNKNRQDIKRCTAHLLSGKKDVDWVVSGPVAICGQCAAAVQAVGQLVQGCCSVLQPTPAFTLPAPGHGLGGRAMWLVRQQGQQLGLRLHLQP